MQFYLKSAIILLNLLFMVGTVDADNLNRIEPNRSNGETLYKAAGCASCHGAPLQKKTERKVVRFKTQFGTIETPNISLTGWDRKMFSQAVREGKKNTTGSYYPIVFPYTSYGLMNDQDVVDIFDYIKSFPAPELIEPKRSISYLSGKRLRLWQNAPIQGLTEELKGDFKDGAYLANAIGHCHECHAERGGLRATINLDKKWSGSLSLIGEEKTSNIEDKLKKKDSYKKYAENFLLRQKKLDGKDIIDPRKKELILGLKSLPIEDNIKIFEYISNIRLNPEQKKEFKALYNEDACATTGRTTAALPIFQDTEVIDEDLETFSVLKSKVNNIFEEYCYTCHAEGAKNAKVFLMPEINSLSKNVEIARNSLNSIKEGYMPKGSKSLNSEQIKDVETWFNAVALDRIGQSDTSKSLTNFEKARDADVDAFSLDYIYLKILEDLQTLDDDDKKFIRYVNFSNKLFLDIHCSEPLERQSMALFIEAGLNKLVNSLSLAPIVKRVKIVENTEGLIFRLDLRDYNWNSLQWEAMTEGSYNSAAHKTKFKEARWKNLLPVYPFALEPKSNDYLDVISAALQSKVPLVDGDWFSHYATKSPLYDMFLNLTDDIKDLEDRLDVDVNSLISSGDVARAAMLDGSSGVSEHNRLLERFALSRGGYYWKSYDFSSSSGKQSLELHPDGPKGAAQYGLDHFEHEGGEMIFSLDNGLQGYYLSEADGSRLQIGPTNIVSHRDRPKGLSVDIENARSCFDCHSDGIISKSDKLRQVLEVNNKFSQKQRERLFKMFVTNEELSELYAADKKTYISALADLNATELNASNRPISLRAPLLSAQKSKGAIINEQHSREIVTFLADRYFYDISLTEVALSLGLNKEEFLDGLKTVNDPFLLKLLLDWKIRDQQSRLIDRAEFESQFPYLLVQLSEFKPLTTYYKGAIDEIYVDDRKQNLDIVGRLVPNEKKDIPDEAKAVGKFDQGKILNDLASKLAENEYIPLHEYGYNNHETISSVSKFGEWEIKSAKLTEFENAAGACWATIKPSLGGARAIDSIGFSPLTSEDHPKLSIGSVLDDKGHWMAVTIGEVSEGIVGAVFSNILGDLSLNHQKRSVEFYEIDYSTESVASLFSDKTLQLKLTSKDREEVFFYDLRGLHEVINVIYNDECQFTTQNDSQWQSIWDAPKQYGSAFRSATEVFSRARVCQLQGYEMLCD